jgi:uncharacterized phage protein gp47/JayE
MLTLAQLLAVATQSGVLQALILFLQGPQFSFPVTDWEEGGVANTLIQLMAAGQAELSQQISNITAGGYLYLAPGLQTSPFQGDWLGLLTQQLYLLARNGSTFTQGYFLFDDSLDEGPFTITAGEYYVQTGDGLVYIAAETAVLPAGETVEVLMEAERPGSVYNIAVGTALTPITALTGVIVTNPAPAASLGLDPSPSGNSWITQFGTDTEQDTALQARCAARWPSLNPIAPSDDVLLLWAQSAAAAATPPVPNHVTRANTSADPNIGGQINMAIAGESGSVPASVVTLVQDYIDPLIPCTCTLAVSAAPSFGAPLTATIYCPTGQQAVAIAQINAAYIQLLDSTPIGGRIYENQVIAILMSPPGVWDCSITSPTFTLGPPTGQYLQVPAGYVADTSLSPITITPTAVGP